MKMLRVITVRAAVSLVTSTAGLAQNVRTDFDHQANFAQYKTYSWQEIKPGWQCRNFDCGLITKLSSGLVVPRQSQ